MNAPAVQFTEEWLNGAIALISEVILEHGAQYAPILDRLERELEQLKLRGDPVTRARRHLLRAQDLARVQAAAPPAEPFPAPAQPG